MRGRRIERGCIDGGDERYGIVCNACCSQSIGLLPGMLFLLSIGPIPDMAFSQSPLLCAVCCLYS